MTTISDPDRRKKALQDYRKKLLEHREIEAKVKECKATIKTTLSELYI